jgi:hypothetical protein
VPRCLHRARASGEIAAARGDHAVTRPGFSLPARRSPPCARSASSASWPRSSPLPSPSPGPTLPTSPPAPTSRTTPASAATGISGPSCPARTSTRSARPSGFARTGRRSPASARKRRPSAPVSTPTARGSVTTGDRRVIVAVLDSGAYWDNRDLVNKYYLNRGELGTASRTSSPRRPAGATTSTSTGPAGSTSATTTRAWATNDRHARRVGHQQKRHARPAGPHPSSARTGAKTPTATATSTTSRAGTSSPTTTTPTTTPLRPRQRRGPRLDRRGQQRRGDIGVCPDCTDAHGPRRRLVRGRRQRLRPGRGLLGRLGRLVIQSALGAINYTAFARQAIDYAYDEQRRVVASAADELSYHHNFPGSGEHSIYVHAIQYDEHLAERSRRPS